MGVLTTPKQALRALAVVCLLAPAGCLVSRAIAQRGGEPAAAGERSGGRALRAAPPVQCGASQAGAIAAKPAAHEGNAEARAGAQRGREAVERVEISVDDVPVHRSCGAGAEYALDAGALDAGVHTVEIAAKDARGRTSRRRLEVYSGAHYLTRLGARFERGQTQISLRNVAPKGTAGRVVFKVFAAGEGPAARGPEVHASTHASSEGPMIVSWDGRDPSGEPRPKGRYVAELSFVDERGRALQSAELPFVHDTPEAQQAAFGEIAGALTVHGQAPAANTWVDLVDERGRVVQRALTTEAGKYRFRNVDGGRYRVRVDRKGFHQSDAPAAAAPAKASEAPTLDLTVK